MKQSPRRCGGKAASALLSALWHPWLLPVLSLALAGCTSPLIDSGERIPGASRKAGPEKGQSGSSSYHLSVIEFDDMGQLAQRGQFTSAHDAIQKLRATQPVLLMMFVHGWKHSARPTDHNFISFEKLVAQAAEAGLVNHAGHPYAVFGVYCGWRGNIYDYPGRDLQDTFPISIPVHFAYFNRDAAAKRVSGITASEVMLALAGAAKKQSLAALTNLIQRPETLWNPETAKVSLPRDPLESRVVIAGHSMGALIVENAVAQCLVGHMAMNNAQYQVAEAFTDSSSVGIAQTWTNLNEAHCRAGEAQRQNDAAAQRLNDLAVPKVMVNQYQQAWTDAESVRQGVAQLLKDYIQRFDRQIRPATNVLHSLLRISGHEANAGRFEGSPVATEADEWSKVNHLIGRMEHLQQDLADARFVSAATRIGLGLGQLDLGLDEKKWASGEEAAREIHGRIEKVLVAEERMAETTIPRDSLPKLSLPDSPDLQPMTNFVNEFFARFTNHIWTLATNQALRSGWSQALPADPGDTSVPSSLYHQARDHETNLIGLVLELKTKRLKVRDDTQKAEEKLEKLWSDLVGGGLPCLTNRVMPPPTPPATVNDCYEEVWRHREAQFKRCRAELEAARKMESELGNQMRMYGSAEFIKRIMGNTLPADLIILINPASSALTSQKLSDAFANPVINVRKPSPGRQFFPGLSPLRPLIINISSKRDTATSTAFPIAHRISSAFKKFASEEQKVLYKNTAAHVPCLVSHTLTKDSWLSKEPKQWMVDSGPGGVARAVPKVDYLQFNLRPRNGWVDSQGVRHELGETLVAAPSGIFRLTPTNQIENEYWVIDCAPELLGGHNEIWTEDFYATVASLVRIQHLYDDTHPDAPNGSASP